MVKGEYVRLSCWLHPTNLGAPAFVAVTYELLGPTACPGVSHCRRTFLPGNDKGSLLLWPTAMSQPYPTAVIFWHVFVMFETEGSATRGPTVSLPSSAVSFGE